MPIILKDKDAVPGEYTGVTQLNVPYQNSEGVASKQKFTNLTSLKAYLLTGADAVNGVQRYTVASSAAYIPNESCFMTEVSETQCQELGYYVESSEEYRIILFLTTKTLTVGETYAVTDMY